MLEKYFQGNLVVGIIMTTVERVIMVLTIRAERDIRATRQYWSNINIIRAFLETLITHIPF